MLFARTLFQIFIIGIYSIMLTLNVSEFNQVVQSILFFTTVPGFHVHAQKYHLRETLRDIMM